MPRSISTNDDGAEPATAPICYVLHRQYNSGGMWTEPRNWLVSPMIAETAKTWMRTMRRGAARRQSSDLIVGRYSTRMAAEQARQRAHDVFVDVEARAAAIKAEMEEACRPFRERLTQLAAERADRTRDETREV